MTPLGASNALPMRGPAAPVDPGPGDPPPVDPPVGAFATDLTIDTAFDADNPKMPDGTSLTGEALTVFNGMKWLMADHDTRVFCISGGSTASAMADNDDTYDYGRNLAPMMDALAIAQRVLKWDAFLDEQVRIANVMYDELAVGYDRNGFADPSKIKWPAGPYLSWRWRYNGPEHDGANYHPDTTRAHIQIARLAYALELNRGKPSTANYNYGAEADKWKSYLRDHFMPLWRGPETEQGENEGGNPASGWASNYKGSYHHLFKIGTENTVRAGVGGQLNWPIFSRHHTHTSMGMTALTYYLGQLFPDEWGDENTPGTAAYVYRMGMHYSFYDRNIFYYNGPYGLQATWPRSMHFTGHGSSSSPNGNYHQPMTYAGYVIKDQVDLWLEGVLARFPEDFAVPVTRQLNHRAFNNLSGDTYNNASQGDIAGNFVMSGSNRPVNKQGTPLHMRSAADFGPWGDPENASVVFSRAYALLLPWDTPDDHMTDHFDDLVRTRAAFSNHRSSGQNPMESCKVLNYSVGRLMQLLDAKNWTPGQ